MRNTLSVRSFLWFVPLLTTGLTYGICIVAVPLIATGYTGWAEDRLGSLNGAAQLFGGIVAIGIGGLAIGKIGAQRALWLLRLCFIILLSWMVLSADNWADSRILICFVIGWMSLYCLSGISDVVINMRLSPPAIAATQFSIFMSVSNMGISLAGILVTSIAALADPKAMLMFLIAVQAFSVVVLLVVKFPSRQIGNDTTLP